MKKLAKIIIGILILFNTSSILLSQSAKKDKKKTVISRVSKDSKSKDSLSSARKATSLKGKESKVKEEKSLKGKKPLSSGRKKGVSNPKSDKKSVG